MRPDLIAVKSASSWSARRLQSAFAMSVQHSHEPTFRNITDFLGWEHDRLEVLLGRLYGCVEEGDFARARTEYAIFADSFCRHVHAEETVLSPVVGARLAALLKDGERAMQLALARMGGALGEGDAPGFRAATRELEETMGPHHFEEERVLYPELDRLLTPAERIALIEQLRRGL